MFERTPIVGSGGDNIYTVALNSQEPLCRLVGESPWARSAHPLQRTSPHGKPVPTSDSVIFP
jgi:hypothetical protein